jgi:hypothetical protein
MHTIDRLYKWENSSMIYETKRLRPGDIVRIVSSMSPHNFGFCQESLENEFCIVTRLRNRGEVEIYSPKKKPDAYHQAVWTGYLEVVSDNNS